jgi:hypothetical protein
MQSKSMMFCVARLSMSPSMWDISILRAENDFSFLFWSHHYKDLYSVMTNALHSYH